MLTVNVTELVYVSDLKSDGNSLMGSIPIIHNIFAILQVLDRVRFELTEII